MLEELYETTPPSTGVYLLVVHGHTDAAEFVRGYVGKKIAG